MMPEDAKEKCVFSFARLGSFTRIFLTFVYYTVPSQKSLSKPSFWDWFVVKDVLVPLKTLGPSFDSWLNFRHGSKVLLRDFCRGILKGSRKSTFNISVDRG